MDCATVNRNGIQFRHCDRFLKCETDTIDIAVRNCGDFYVYKSQVIPLERREKDTGVFCGTEGTPKGKFLRIILIINKTANNNYKSAQKIQQKR